MSILVSYLYITIFKPVGWPYTKKELYYTAGRIVNLMSDEAGGELTVQVAFDDAKETEFVYEGVCYSQLDENSVGLFVIEVSEITQSQLKNKNYAYARKQLFGDLGADEAFLTTYTQRGNKIFAHHAKDGVRIVLAKRLALGETIVKNSKM